MVPPKLMGTNRMRPWSLPGVSVRRTTTTAVVTAATTAAAIVVVAAVTDAATAAATAVGAVFLFIFLDSCQPHCSSAPRPHCSFRFNK